MVKILYAIQGTGNGHISRAREIIPHLKKHGDVDLVVSGTHVEIGLDEPVKFRLHGLGFKFGKSGGVDFLATIKQFQFLRFLYDLKRLPVNDYDLIINDFEPVTSWACKFRGKKNVGLSHQCAYKSPKTPQLKGFHWGKLILDYYAPSDAYIGFHFERFDDFINKPVIRREIRNLETSEEGHYTVYLPAYSDEFILSYTEKMPDAKWHIFSKHSKEDYSRKNAKVFALDNEKFLESLADSAGLLTGGGFEGPAEALFLKKKVLAVPMKNQYEQQCNALGLEKLGVPVVWSEDEFGKKLKDWVENGKVVPVDFPDETEKIIADLVAKYGDGKGFEK